ncbi:hypothetical protein NECAME_06294 [Necator americanus]|uniref:PI3K/PI4K catalytic domain-containing protein n=1 Tax=Necator americanus TaxID=51031 RepID=W2TUA4_NECAM|nr:hypothetical protein NECAME_06294 [Necator americanus]ETN85675.1 hypothetical protein NECAME_06294 [Necator americanus]
MNLVTYVVGLGDRHLSNVLFETDTCKLVHIDLGMILEYSKRTLPIPERVPFRLTRDLLDPVLIEGTGGRLVEQAIYAMQLLRESKHVILGLASVLLRETISNFEEIDSGSGERPSFVSETAIARLRDKLNGTDDTFGQQDVHHQNSELRQHKYFIRSALFYKSHLLGLSRLFLNTFTRKKREKDSCLYVLETCGDHKAMYVDCSRKPRMWTISAACLSVGWASFEVSDAPRRTRSPFRRDAPARLLRRGYFFREDSHGMTLGDTRTSSADPSARMDGVVQAADEGNGGSDVDVAGLTHDEADLEELTEEHFEEETLVEDVKKGRQSEHASVMASVKAQRHMMGMGAFRCPPKYACLGCRGLLTEAQKDRHKLLGCDKGKDIKNAEVADLPPKHNGTFCSQCLAFYPTFRMLCQHYEQEHGLDCPVEEVLVKSETEFDQFYKWIQSEGGIKFIGTKTRTSRDGSRVYRFFQCCMVARGVKQAEELAKRGIKGRPLISCTAYVRRIPQDDGFGFCYEGDNP